MQLFMCFEITTCYICCLFKAVLEMALYYLSISLFMNE